LIIENVLDNLKGSIHLVLQEYKSERNYNYSHQPPMPCQFLCDLRYLRAHFATNSKLLIECLQLTVKDTNMGGKGYGLILNMTKIKLLKVDTSFQKIERLHSSTHK
jgi:hypothetical protein